MKRLSPELKILLLLTIPIAALMVMHYLTTGFVIYNDGRAYYSYLRSAAIDHDINFTNEWAYYNSVPSGFSSQTRAVSFPVTTKTGYLENIHLIGNAIMWSPAFLITHAASLLLSSAGLPVNTNGFGPQYEFSVGIASMIYGLLGIWLIYKFCRKWFERKTALLATIAVWYGTAAFWYHSIEPSMAHMNSMFLVASFTYLWHSTLEKRTKLQWLALGLILGLIALVRQQEILLGMLPAFELIGKLARKFDIGTAIKSATSSILLGIGTIVMFIPQMLAWKAIYGSYITYSYGGPATTEYWYWTLPQIIQMITSPEAGMWRVPTMLLSIIGLFLFARRTNGIAWYFFAVVMAQALLIASWTGWSVSYGIRYFIGMSIFFVLGAAELIELVKSRIGIKAVYAVIALLIAGNFVNMLAVMLTEITSRMPLGEVIRILKWKLF